MTAVRKLKDFLRVIRRTLIKRTRIPPVGQIDFGSFDRQTPISNYWGFDRGEPIDRVYIEQFIAANAEDIKGVVLEVADNKYTTKFGGGRVIHSDILHNTTGNSRATMVLDLVNTDEAPNCKYDCIICTQTLHLIYDLRSAILTLNKMLKPGGVLLLTAPTITQISREDLEAHGDHWRFTSPTLRRLFADGFPGSDIEIKSYGNVYAAVSFLHGLAVEEVDETKLAYLDQDYEMLIGVRVRKQEANG